MALNYLLTFPTMAICGGCMSSIPYILAPPAGSPAEFSSGSNPQPSDPKSDARYLTVSSLFKSIRISQLTIPSRLCPYIHPPIPFLSWSPIHSSRLPSHKKPLPDIPERLHINQFTSRITSPRYISWCSLVRCPTIQR